MAKNWDTFGIPVFSDDSLVERGNDIKQAFATHPSFREAFIEHYEFKIAIDRLRHKREWLRTRGYPVVEQLNQCNEEIWALVGQQEKRDREYEFLRRMFAYELPELSFTE